MRTRWRHEGDQWTTAGPKINSAENLAAVKSLLDERGPIIVEWWHYRGSSAPDRVIFDDFEKFESWLQDTSAGDLIDVWDWEEACRQENVFVSGKCPDEAGEVPEGGAY